MGSQLVVHLDKAVENQIFLNSPIGTVCSQLIVLAAYPDGCAAFQSPASHDTTAVCTVELFGKDMGAPLCICSWCSAGKNRLDFIKCISGDNCRVGGAGKILRAFSMIFVLLKGHGGVVVFLT